MTDAPVVAVAAPAPSAPEPEAVALPTPIHVEPRTAVQDGEVARQAEEAKVKAGEAPEPKKVEPEVKKPLSTREVLRAAREKVEAEPSTQLKTEAKAEPKAADAKTAEAPVKAVEPKETPKVVNGPDGKFVSTDPAKVAAKEAETAKAALPSHTAEPAPKRFSKEAQDEWAAAPEKVRSEVARMEKELTQGFEKHRVAATRDAELEEFHTMAAKGNTTVKEALSKYVNMEQLIRRDPDKGLEALFQNIGISPREWATKLLGTAPDVAANKQESTILELRQELADLKNGLGQIQQERTQTRTATTTEAVTKFAADHPRFEELSEDIAFFLKTRHPGDLAKAYEAADRLNPVAAVAKPEPTPASAASSATNVTPLTTPAAASSAAAKSINGAPTAGSDPTRKQPSSSIKEAIRKATRQVA